MVSSFFTGFVFGPGIGAGRLDVAMIFFFFRYIIHDDYHVEVRACVAIAAGEEITDHYVTPLNGTQYRRSHLKDGWFFDCVCPRCRDPTEKGAMTSAFVCPANKCSRGALLPSDPLDPKSPWKCTKCKDVVITDWEKTLGPALFCFFLDGCCREFF